MDGEVEKINAYANANKVAIVTGSSMGIGRAIAIELAKDSVEIVVNSEKTSHEGVEVVNEIERLGRQALYIQADVSDFDQNERMTGKIIDNFGRIDILVNNAGIIIDKRLKDMMMQDWNKVISVDLTTVFNCTKCVIEYMQKQKSGKNINLASISGQIGNIGQANYSAAKGGVISFTKTIAKEYAADSITANAIAPGFIKTRMLDNISEKVMEKILKQIPLRRLGKPEEVAKLVRFLASDDANYITGQVINMNGGLYM
ncbi:beta-ketoacyl-ACP reductase [ANME-1 cluster archaeon AG-394-G21]|nr:beta-ketoacyl-ACP reductase [ANME-1 cluster archaeon AG-394-G21]